MMNMQEFDRRVKYVTDTKKVSYATAAYWVRRYMEAKERTSNETK